MGGGALVTIAAPKGDEDSWTGAAKIFVTGGVWFTTGGGGAE